MIDETLTFLFASTQSQKQLIYAMIYFFIIKPDVRKRVQEEIKYHLEQVGGDWHKLLSYEYIGELRYLNWCFMECLRMYPPVTQSTFMKILEPLTIKDLHLHKNSNVVVGIRQLQNNPEEWQRPQEFLPERFNVESPLYLTPSGKKRSQVSYCPFFGGKRICLGKTFAEKYSLIMVAQMVHFFDYEMLNKDFY